MRCLVTGGAGFLGSHLCDRLLAEGEQVTAVDNLYTGEPRNIEHLQTNRSFRFLRHDIIEPLDLEVDWIFNLACPASPVHYQADPIKTVKTSALGALHMLDLAERRQARILQASTSEIYGDPLEHPQKETYWGNVNPTGVRACYDEGKRVAETLMMEYHRQRGVDTRIARIFNTYGPRMAVGDGRVISNFIVQALRAQPLTVYGDGSQTRCFCYVDDLIDGLFGLMRCAAPDAAEPVNLGASDERSMREVVAALSALMGRDLPVRNLPLPADDPQRRRPDCTRAARLLGWKPKVDLAEGLRNTVEYFSTLLESTRRMT